MFIEKFRKSHIQNIKIKHFSQPFYRKIPQISPSSPILPWCNFCPQYITASPLLRIANDIQLAVSAFSFPSFFLIFKPYLKELTTSISFTYFFSWLPFCFTFCMTLFSATVLNITYTTEIWFISSVSTYPLRPTLTSPSNQFLKSKSTRKSSKFSLKYGLNLTIPYHKLSYHPNTLDCVSTIFLPWTK